RHLPSGPGPPAGRVAGKAPGQSGPRPHFRLRWQGPRRPAARSRGGGLRPLPGCDQGVGPGRRDDVDRAGVFARAGQDRRLGQGSLRVDEPADAGGGPATVRGLIRSSPVILALIAVVGWPLLAMVREATKPEDTSGPGTGEIV